MIKDISVVLLGAGKSKRFDTNTLKQNVKIHDKRVIDYSVDFFRKHFNASKKYFVINKKVDGSTLGYPHTNAVKEVKNNTIYYNIHKSNLWSTFTPQIFKMEKLYHSVKICLDEKYYVDDDIEALLLNSLKCSMIMSSPTNIKVTYKSDINYIKKLL